MAEREDQLVESWKRFAIHARRSGFAHGIFFCICIAATLFLANEAWIAHVRHSIGTAVASAGAALAFAFTTWRIFQKHC